MANIPGLAPHTVIKLAMIDYTVKAGIAKLGVLIIKGTEEGGIGLGNVWLGL